MINKFDYCISNPPYQINGVNGSAAKNIYPDFMYSSIYYSLKNIMVHPARAFVGPSRSDKTIVNNLLKNNHYKTVYFNNNSEEIFRSIGVEGGIIITKYDETVNVINNLKDSGSITIINEIVNKILQKNNNNGCKTIDNIIFKNNIQINYNDKNYGFSTNIFDKLSDIFVDYDASKTNDYLAVFGRFNGQRTYKMINKKYIVDCSTISDFKVFVPVSNGSTTFGYGKTRVIGSTILSKKGSVATQTFLSFGELDNIVETKNLQKYLETKFVRALVGSLKKTQHNNRNIWRNVPLQDFTDTSDINWNTTSKQLCDQLYKKYDLNDNEINYIEYNIT